MPVGRDRRHCADDSWRNTTSRPEPKVRRSQIPGGSSSSLHHLLQFLVPEFDILLLQGLDSYLRNTFGHDKISQPHENADLIGSHLDQVDDYAAALSNVRAQS